MSEQVNISKEREAGPDIVRFIACFFVVAVHFYLNVGYYNEPMVGGKMFVMTAARWLFLTCVPLFFMLTGYFKINKLANKAHYKALISLFFSYIIISLVKMLIQNRIYGKIRGIKEMLMDLGNYNIAWYMGIYLCLFLLIPFLNKMWHVLELREKKILLATLIFICSIYPVFNYIAPSFFVGIYPIMYYFLGAYIRENKPLINKFYLLAVLCIVCLAQAIISMKFTKTGFFDLSVITTADMGYGSVLVMICAVCIFMTFVNVDIKVKPIKKFIASVGKVTFEIYLFAGIYDALIYQYLKRTLSSATEFFWWFFITVPLSFILAYISSVIFSKIKSLIIK